MQKNLSTFSFAIFIVSVLSGCSTPHSALYSPPSVLPNVTSNMKTSGFWISRHPYPDQVILSDEQIEQFNKKVEERQLIKNLAHWPTVAGVSQIKQSIDDIVSGLKSRSLMRLDGSGIPGSFWQDMEKQINVKAIAESVYRQYGLITRYSNQRLLPTEEGLYAKAQDVDFDELQNSALDIGVPVVILHQSQDGKWMYVESETSGGWVASANIALISDAEFNQWVSSPFVIVTAPKADLFSDREMTKYVGYLQMGSRLPMKQKNDGQVEVTFPIGQSTGKAILSSGFIAIDQIHEGVLTYTPRHILKQAFSLLHQPYGWGGMYGEQDCSRFLQQIFSTVGITLPRNSKEQQQVVNILSQDETAASNDKKLTLLKDKAVGGVTLLGMKGHIMLYVGSVDDTPYALHEVWAYRQAGQEGDDIFVLNRVTLSDLSLGKGSKKGSLLDRLNTVVEIK